MSRRPKSAQVASKPTRTALKPLTAEIVETEASAETPDFTFKQRLFVEAYVGVARGNGTRAAEIAGYEGDSGTLSAIASENLRKPHIAAEIKRRTEELAAKIGMNELVNAFADDARASYADFIDINPDGTFSFNLAKAERLGVLHHIEDLHHDKETGAPVVKIVNRQGARMNLAKLKGLGKDAGPPPAQTNIQINVRQQLEGMSTEEIKRLREAQKQLTEGDK